MKIDKNKKYGVYRRSGDIKRETVVIEIREYDSSNFLVQTIDGYVLLAMKKALQNDGKAITRIK